MSLLICWLVIVIASFEKKRKFVTKAVSISINYTSHVI